MPATGWPSRPTRTSPSSRPARSAGPPGSTATIRTPAVDVRSSGGDQRRGQRDGLHRDADPAPADAAVADQAAGDELGRVDRDREADPLRRQDDRRVDADHLAPRVDQRAARVAGVQRRVGLEDVVDQPAGLRPGATGPGR